MNITHPVRRAGTALVALLAGLLTLLASAPAASAAAPPDVQTVLNTWKGSDPLFVENGAALSSSQQSEIRSTLEDSQTKIYMAALTDASLTDSQSAGAYIQQLGRALGEAGRPDATVVVFDGTRVFAASGAMRSGMAGRMANLSAAANQGDAVAVTQDLVERINLAADGRTRDALRSGSLAGSGSAGFGVLIGILVIALAGGLGLFFYARRAKRRREEREAAELAAVKQTVEEDVTKFGEEITALDADVRLLGESGGHLDEWQQALDAYEKAKTQLAAVKRPEDVREVTTTLEDGRYALAVVKARVNEQPVPERRAPCFFNPQHGPSSRDVRWAPPGGAVRDVPACAADAEAIEGGFDPQTREVVVNGVRRPYYDAGPAYQPYAYGYYGGFGDVMSMMLVGTMLGSMMSGGFGYGGYDQGMADSGFGDAGGGGDFGGGGGFDFGGGDFGGDW